MRRRRRRGRLHAASSSGALLGALTKKPINSLSISLPSPSCVEARLIISLCHIPLSLSHLTHVSFVYTVHYRLVHRLVRPGTTSLCTITSALSPRATPSHASCRSRTANPSTASFLRRPTWVVSIRVRAGTITSTWAPPICRSRVLATPGHLLNRMRAVVWRCQAASAPLQMARRPARGMRSR